MLAGRDTTACMLTWCLYRLGKHPEIQERVRKEVKNMEMNGEKLSYQTASSLSLLNAFILETLRLHPSVPVDSKYTIEDCQLPDGTPLSAGTVIGYMPIVINRMEKFWKDGEEFLPERWLEKEKRQPTNFEYPTFNAGPRTCLGRYLAMLEGKLTLASLLSRFQIVLKKGFQPEYITTITLVSKDPVPVRFIPLAQK